jgi:hypothetical protein
VAASRGNERNRGGRPRVPEAITLLQTARRKSRLWRAMRHVIISKPVHHGRVRDHFLSYHAKGSHSSKGGEPR